MARSVQCAGQYRTWTCAFQLLLKNTFQRTIHTNSMYLKKLMRPKIINKWIKTSVKRQVHGMILHVVIIFNLVNFIFLEPLFRVPDIESKYDTTSIIATQRRYPVTLHSMDSIIFTRDYPPVFSRISSTPAILLSPS